MKNIRSSQPCISMNSFDKAQVLPCQYLKCDYTLAYFVINRNKFYFAENKLVWNFKFHRNSSELRISYIKLLSNTMIYFADFIQSLIL